MAARRARTAGWFIAFAALLFASCTRMPVAPRAEITVHGSVTDAEGDPVDALLHFHGDASLPSDIATAATDSAGAYSVALTEGFYEVDVAPLTDGFLRHRRRATLSRGHQRFDVVFSGYRVEGIVREPDGGTPAGAMVWARRNGSSYYDTEVAISGLDSNGGFAFVLPKGFYELAVLVGPFPTTRRNLSVESDTTVHLVLDGIRVEGTIRERGGLPMVEALVYTPGEPGFVYSQTDSIGRYAIYVTPGVHRFLVDPREAFLFPYLSGAVNVQAPATIDFDLSGVEWTGVIYESGTGAPVSGALVRVLVFGDEWDRGARCDTDASGAFRLIVQPGERYDLRVYRDPDRPPDLHLADIPAGADTSFILTLAPALQARALTPTPAPPAARDIPSPGSSAP